MRWITEEGSRVPYIIAEVGASHNGHITNALQLINEAAHAGCDAVKFQYFNAERLAERRHAEAYIENYRRYEVPSLWLPILEAACRKEQIELVLSVYDMQGYQDAKTVTKSIKIASFESGDRELLDYVSRDAGLVIVSTGLTTHDDLEALLRWRNNGANQRALLHCISAYPCPMDQLRLRLIRAYDLDGFSDHSGRTTTGGLAVASGAKMLEVHIRQISTPVENPDFGHSLDPGPLFDYVRFSREAMLATSAPYRRTIEGAEIPMSAYRVRATR